MKKVEAKLDLPPRVEIESRRRRAGIVDHVLDGTVEGTL
jgi:hypothetical protein